LEELGTFVFKHGYTFVASLKNHLNFESIT